MASPHYGSRRSIHLSPDLELRGRRLLVAGLVASSFVAAGCSAANPTNPMPSRADNSNPPRQDGAKASPSPSASAARAKYEPAFVQGTPGSVCTLHPAGNTDPKESLPASIDEDGVARFQARRPTLPNDADRLALDCTDPAGNAKSYSIDLRSNETYAPHPFDSTRTNWEVRPALAGDPLAQTREALIQGGYGLRPDPQANPAGFARWLEAARVPARKARTVKRSLPRPAASSRTSGGRIAPENTKTIDKTGYGANWSGAVLSGSRVPNANSALAVSYAMNEMTLTVPSVVPSAFGIGGTYVSLWNGLDLGTLLQAEVWVNTNSSSSTYFVHHQCFSNDGAQNPNSANVADDRAITFTPSAGDSVYSQVWYCDATGNVDMLGGYACTYMSDMTSGIAWVCDQANSTSCASFQILPADVGNGAIGGTAEFIIENDDSQAGYTQGPWPDFTAPVTMAGSALVVTGRNGSERWVSTGDDPNITLLEDFTPLTNPDHLLVSVDSIDDVFFSVVPGGWNVIPTPTGGVGFPESGPGFAAADPGGTAYSIGRNFNSQGNSWIISSTVSSSGQPIGWANLPGAANDVAVSPDGVPWVLAAGGSIYRWNGSSWIGEPGCATSIGVGAGDQAWITGCSNVNRSGDHSIYRWDGSNWVRTSGAARKVAVSPEGRPWVVTSAGGIYRWDGSQFQGLPGCALSIGVGSSDQAWVIGCDLSSVYQWLPQSQNWSYVPGPGGARISVTPNGTPWIVDALGTTLSALIP